MKECVIQENQKCSEVKCLIRKLKAWYEDDQEKLINIVTYPYNEIRIFKSLIYEVLKSNGRVLYLGNNEEKYKEIITVIKNLGKHITYSKAKDGCIDSEASINFSSIGNTPNIKGKYDLVILDDISALSSYSKLELQDFIDYFYKNSKKIIAYTFEEIFLNVRVLYAGNALSDKPFIEPRVIKTRVDLEEDIPFVIYDYLKWFKSQKRKILMLTPDSEKKELVYEYYLKKLKISDKIKVFKYSEEHSNKLYKEVNSIKDNAVIIVSEVINEEFRNIPNLDIIVYFSDDRWFDYKKIIYLCGKVGEKNKEGEVLLLSNEVSDNIDLAKEYARQYNKISWEKGLLS